MDILLYKDGHLAVSESPLEGKENNLKDVVMLITNPQEGDSLTYKGGKWVNGAGGSGGGGLVVHLTKNSDNVTTADRTAGEIIAAAGTEPVIFTRAGLGSTVYYVPLGMMADYLDDPEPEAIFGVGVQGQSGYYELTATSADSYPSYDGGQG